MPTVQSTQHKLDRIRPPRVQITYDVEVGDATEKKELPLVVGILADLAGMPADPPPRMKDRKFVEIDRDNFNEVLAAIGPRLELLVSNKLTNDGSKLKAELNFQDMEDFDPLSIIEQIEPMRRLFEARKRLNDLLTKLDGNDQLEQLLQQVVENTEQLSAIKVQIEGESGAEEQTEEQDGTAPTADSPEDQPDV